tara:strand:+ start:1641 stop:1901 length:261 start_codon:yes stop_codon:yes gene_type:complete
MPKTQSISIAQAIENITTSRDFQETTAILLLKQNLKAIASSLESLSIAPFNSLNQVGCRTKESNELAKVLMRQLDKKILKQLRSLT